MERRRTRVPYQSGNSRTSSRRTDDVPSEASPPPTQEPMQIDPIRGPLTESEREDRRQKGLCLYCGKAGHLIRSCPVRPSRPAGNANSRPL
ncbi:hypothetical protein NDU88_011059 [Pleurodeles waltl]|uniref:CCHC-type domain-containing protein n=1 Tax=Pleurodeles waltl TaxID=8319 RepID=A0AAV7PWP8_PLEWA|nr:hypothetical protein NDU88_011059 [Pleurodeles waltl]